MKTYEKLIREYRKRNISTAADTAAAAMPYLDELAEQAGLMLAEQTAAVTDAAGNVLPFAVIAVSEAQRVLAGRKPAATGLRDGIRRMIKTTAALGVGAAAGAVIGAWAAAPAAMGVRWMLDKHKSRMTTGLRVRERTERLRELNVHIARQTNRNMIESAEREGIPGEIVEIYNIPFSEGVL